jgi:hypothetical protein
MNDGWTYPVDPETISLPVVSAVKKVRFPRKGPDLRAELRSWMRECDTCGERHTATLVWHHIGEKTDGVTRIAQSGDRVAMLRELTRCRLLCANCHSIAHWSTPSYMK